MSGDYVALAGAAVGGAVRTLLKTIAGTFLLAFILAGIAFWIAFDGSWQRGLLAVVLVLIEVAIIGGILAAKRAVLGGVIGGLQKQKLGQAAARLVLNPRGPLGDVAERIPLGEAERRLRLAVDSTLGSAAQQQGIRATLARSIQERLIRGIEQLTLVRFRSDAAEHEGKVDLAKVAAEVGDRADALLLDKLGGMATKLTALLVLASTAIAVLVAFLLRQWNPGA
ncbi:MAG TPA: hypothetical protein VFB81_09635 [Myxococcales bacterium]|nr:hypothetical protein [Myxococcales bacterium]